MHANFHILCFSSANMAFSLTFTQTARTFLSLSLALASFSRAFFAVCLTSFALLHPLFPELSFCSHWQVGEHSEAQTSSLEPKVQFHSHEDRLRYQAKQRKDTQDQPYNDYNLRTSSKIIQTQTCSQNTSLLIAHMLT